MRSACSADSDAVVRYPSAAAASRHASRTARSSSTIRRFSNDGLSTCGGLGTRNVLGAMAAVIDWHLGNQDLVLRAELAIALALSPTLAELPATAQSSLCLCPGWFR